LGSNPNVGYLGETYPTLHTSGKIPEEILKKGMHNIGKLAYMTKEIVPFSHFIYTRFGEPKKTVDTREYPVAEISELDRLINVKVGGDNSTYGVTNRTNFGVTNDQAAQLQTNDILYRRDKFIKPVTSRMVLGQVIPQSGGTQGTNYGPDFPIDVGGYVSAVRFSDKYGLQNDSEYMCDPEPITITNVGAKDSAGTGYTLITIDRVYCGPDVKSPRGGELINRNIVYSSNGITGTTNGGTGDTTNGDHATIKVGEVLLLGCNSFFEGTGAPNGLFKSIEIDRNFTQEMKYAVEMTNESDIEATWISDKPMEINRWLVAKRKARQIENLFVWGKKGVTQDKPGKRKYLMGGVHEFIKKDSDHFLTYEQSSLSWDQLLIFSTRVSVLGGSPEKFVFCGYSLDAYLRGMFYKSGYMRFEPALSKEFNMEVNAIIGSGIKLNIVPSQIMEEAGFGMKGLCLDLGVPSFVPVTHVDWDLKVKKDVAPKDTEIYKELSISMIGLERRYQDYHSILDFSNVR